MIFHGAAVALSRKSEERLKYTLTTIFVDENEHKEDPDSYHKISEHCSSGEFNFREPAQIFEVSRNIISSINYCTTTQQTSFAAAWLQYQDVCLVLGEDTRANFAMPSLWYSMFPNPDLILSDSQLAEVKGYATLPPMPWGILKMISYFPDREPPELVALTKNGAWREKAIRGRLASVLENERALRLIVEHENSLATNNFLAGLSADEAAKMRTMYRDLESAINLCALSLNNFIKPDEKKIAKFRAVVEGENEALIRERADYFNKLKKGVDAGDKIAIQILVEYAKHHAVQIAESHGKNPDVFKMFVPWDDYAQRPDLQKRYPIFAYMNWHADIRKAFLESYYAAIDVPYSFNFKLPLDPDGPPFIDALLPLIKDRILVKNGLRRANILNIADRNESGWIGLMAQEASRMHSDAWERV